MDRRGIRHLQEHGVAVHMFDPDLQREIRAFNQPFLEQALQRAEMDKEARIQEAPLLSPLERTLPGVAMDDLSSEALDRYRTAVGSSAAEESEEIVRRLSHLGLLQQHAGRLVPTGFGFLLFGREPRTVMPQSGVLGTIHFADGREEVRDFDGPQVFAPEQVLRWLGEKLPNPIDRSGARRVETNRELFEMIREAVVNAIIHRDYGIEGAKCQLAVTEDIVSVMSPGQPVEPVTMEQMQSLDAPMLSRNPVLHYVFSRMELAEERGLGLRSIRKCALDAGLPLPRYRWKAPYLELTIYRNGAALAADLSGQAVLELLNFNQRAAWDIVSRQESVTTGELVKRLGFDERKVQRILRGLQDAGLLQRLGKGRATRYAVVAD